MNNKENKMWGGRFAKAPDELLQTINASIDFDKRLYAHDIKGSRAHAKMLCQQGIISAQTHKAIDDGLVTILGEIESGKFKFSAALEDIHMNIEARLQTLIGEDAGKLHTARSRNDQIATDLKLFTIEASQNTIANIENLQRVLLTKAEENAETIMAGFTHLQSAQPILFAHHCLAYVEMFGRDKARFISALANMNECPLGSAALAGTSFNIDRHSVAKDLGFGEPTRNSLDSVSSRDFVLEFISCASICATHLSRLAEEIILWTTPQFNFIHLPDEWATGSSIMPQKRNADAAELIRAKVGRINGAFITLATIMKAVPLAYSKDMQEDKEPLFDVVDTLTIILPAMAGMVEAMKINKQAMAKAAGSGYATATDLADWLVKNDNMPFRQAHHIVGEIVALAADKKCQLEQLELADMQKIYQGFTKDVFNVISVEASVNARVSYGGTAMSQVKKQISYWKEKLK